MDSKPFDFAATFECLGVNIGPRTGSNAKCDCPLCGKAGHFFLNLDTGQWDCKVCGRNGNVYSFMSQLLDVAEHKTTPEMYEEIAKSRGIPSEAFTTWPVVWNEAAGEWLFPNYGTNGVVRGFGRWRKGQKKIYETTGCGTHIFGLYYLVNAQEARKRRVWICEGYWDAIALRWLLNQVGSYDIVISFPGAGTFKKAWHAYFQECDIVWAFDNDESGDVNSMDHSQKLMSIARKQQFICWPETFRTGYDINNHVSEGLEKQIDPAIIFANLEALIQPDHRRSKTADATKPSLIAKRKEEIGPPCAFPEVLDTFKKWMELDRDFIDCLICALAVPLANGLGGEPLFFYMIGVPGSGKTRILDALSTSPTCSFHSSLSAKTLVSGFNRDPDPSLLPKLNGLTAVFKDGTELLAVHPDARNEIYATLRGAFDGRVDRPYGNGITRKYTDLKFNMLIGVTPKIRAYTEATAGERFLNLEMHENLNSANKKIYKCVTEQTAEVESNMMKELSDVCARFLNRDVDPQKLPLIPETYVHRIVAMAQLVALLRAQVDRDWDRDLKYRARGELGTRVAKQLAKLGRMICIVLGKAEVDEQVCRLLRKVMVDSCVGFHIDILKSLIRNKNEPMTAADLSVTSEMTAQTVAKRLEDMVVLRILQSHKKVRVASEAFAAARYSLSDRVMALWQTALDGIQREF